jgi:hypothetical protein
MNQFFTCEFLNCISGMWESQRRIKDIVEELELDVIGLLETDLQRIVMGNRDL